MRSIYLGLAGALALTCGAGAPAAAQSFDADTIYTDGQFYTPDGWKESMAVKDGVIIAIGSQTDVNPFKSGKTRTVDLNGATVLPGLHDMHVHPMGAGLRQLQCRWDQGASLQDVLDAVAACVKDRKAGEWISGGQWDVVSMGVAPHKSLLDKVAPDNPVVLADISGHSSWMNSKALEIAGITNDTPNPPDGIIERDENGEATGVFREEAAGLVRRHIPAATQEQNTEALKWSLDLMLSFGITSFMDAGINMPGLQAYAALSDRGDLKQRVKGCVMETPLAFTAMEETAISAIDARNIYARERFSPTCVKLGLDGVPTDGHTAAMVDPYADAHNHMDPRAKGMIKMTQDQVDERLIKYDAMGITVKMHAAGDAAVRSGLDGIAAARAANGFSGVMHDVGHNSFIQLSDTLRARDIGATFEMSPYIWYPNPIIPDIAAAIGPERMARWTPVRDAIDGGALVVPGSDWSVVPSVDPWIAIETLVTRQAPGGVGEPLGDPITLGEAIDLFTVNSAVQMDNRDKTGVLEVGMLADMVIVDQNPFDVPVTDIHKTKVLMTVIEGETVYSAK